MGNSKCSVLLLLVLSACELVRFPVECHCHRRRRLFDKDVIFGEAKLREWGVPEDADLLVQSESCCGEFPPVQAMAKKAFLCGAFTKIRNCMNISAIAPFTIGRNCSGTKCPLKLNAEDQAAASQCAFKYLAGLDVQPQNTTRQKTCGLAPSEYHWFEPFQNPANVGEVACAGAYPEGVIHKVSALCERKAPIYVQELAFPVNLTDRKYTCFESPQCRDGTKYVSEMVCYSESSGKEEKEQGYSRVEVEVQGASESEAFGGSGDQAKFSMLFFVSLQAFAAVIFMAGFIFSDE